jgi:hypothetical protein
LAFPQANPWTAAIFVDEFNTGRLESAPNNVKRCTTRLTETGLELMNSHNPHMRVPSEFLLGPSK